MELTTYIICRGTRLAVMNALSRPDLKDTFVGEVSPSSGYSKFIISVIVSYSQLNLSIRRRAEYLHSRDEFYIIDGIIAKGDILQHLRFLTDFLPRSYFQGFLRRNSDRITGDITDNSHWKVGDRPTTLFLPPATRGKFFYYHRLASDIPRVVIYRLNSHELIHIVEEYQGHMRQLTFALPTPCIIRFPNAIYDLLLSHDVVDSNDIPYVMFPHPLPQYSWVDLDIVTVA
jgi:hypothetical protein